jgi:hypothetical protein
LEIIEFGDIESFFVEKESRLCKKIDQDIIIVGIE